MFSGQVEGGYIVVSSAHLDRHFTPHEILDAEAGFELLLKRPFINPPRSDITTSQRHSDWLEWERYFSPIHPVVVYGLPTHESWETGDCCRVVRLLSAGNTTSLVV